MSHFLFEQLAHNPEPALNAEHPAPFNAGNVPKAFKNPPKDAAPKVSQQVHSELKGMHSDSDFFPFPSEYLQTPDGRKK